MKTSLAVLPMLLFCGAALLECAGPGEDDLPRLEFLASMPKEVIVGDTTDPQDIRKVSVDARGREDENSEYRSFSFESSDTAVLKVVDKRRLLGVAAGEASVSAFDELSTAETKGSIKVTVKPSP